MKTIFLNINDEIYIIKNLTYNNTTKSYKIDTKKPETWGKNYFSMSSWVDKLCIYRKSFQEPSNEDCEHVSNDLNLWHFTEWTQ